MKKNSPGRIALDVISWVCGGVGAYYVADIIPSVFGDIAALALFCVVSVRIFMLRCEGDNNKKLHDRSLILGAVRALWYSASHLHLPYNAAELCTDANRYIDLCQKGPEDCHIEYTSSFGTEYTAHLCDVEQFAVICILFRLSQSKYNREGIEFFERMLH